MKFFRLLLASGFCLLCIFSIGTPIEASTITIQPLDINWHPRAISDCSTDEEKEKTYANVTITLQNVDFPTDPNSKKLPYVKVFLSEVTEWKGICGNDSDSEYSTLPSHLENDDLVLERTDSHNSEWYKNKSVINGYKQYDGTLSRTLGRNDSSISVKVSCKDYGAFGKITATLYDYGGAGDYKSKDSNTVRIPRDDNKNKIADIWEDKPDVNLTAAEKEDVELDVETGPGDANTNDGDGLSIFAEYRGFKLYKYSRSRWQYTSPRKKDIFVTWSGNISEHKAGYADEMPLEVNLVEQSYINNPNESIDEDTTKWVNYNNEGIPGHKRVYAIFVRADAHRETTEVVNDQGVAEDKPVFGRATPSPSIPSHDSIVTIYTNNISDHHNGSPQGDIDNAIKNVIAHEVAHCVRLNHCPTTTCPDGSDTYCYMDRYRDRTSTSTVFGNPHDPYYDAHTENGAAQPVDPSQVTPPGVDPAPAVAGSNGNGSSGNTIISTNTGISLEHGCDYNAANDYCTDTGTCGSATDSSTNGLCGHRWCICPAAPSSDSSDTEASDDTGTTDTSAPAIGPCGHTYWLGSSSDYDHRSETWGCGHTIYVCQSSSHSLQASCSETNANGDSCTVTNFYACQTHTHEYPPTTVSCARQECDVQLSTRFDHRIDCGNCGGHYWTCITGASYDHTTTFTCRRAGCGQTFTRCNSGPCTSDSGTHVYHWAQ